MALVHGPSLTDETLTPQDYMQLEAHYLRVLLIHLRSLALDGKMEELTKTIDITHPTYRGRLLDQLEPMEVEACSEDEAMMNSGQ